MYDLISFEKIWLYYMFNNVFKFYLIKKTILKKIILSVIKNTLVLTYVWSTSIRFFLNNIMRLVIFTTLSFILLLAQNDIIMAFNWCRSMSAIKKKKNHISIIS